MQCGTWTKHAEGGIFTSPNYPSKYPPDRECIYIIEGEGAKSGLAVPELRMDSVHIGITEIASGDRTHKYLWVKPIAIKSGIELIIEMMSKGFVVVV